VKQIDVLGAGGATAFHLAAAARFEGAQAVHIADINLTAANRLAKQYSVEKVSGDPAKVVANRDVDTIIIALPTHLHCEWIIRCAQSGKNILVETPLCRTVEDA
jgi:predicted dehydrogenase